MQREMVTTLTETELYQMINSSVRQANDIEISLPLFKIKHISSPFKRTIIRLYKGNQLDIKHFVEQYHKAKQEIMPPYTTGKSKERKERDIKLWIQDVYNYNKNSKKNKINLIGE